MKKKKVKYLAYILQLFPREMLGLTASDALIIVFIFTITISSPLQFKKACKEVMTLRMIKHRYVTIHLRKDVSKSGSAVICYRNNDET